VLGLGGWAEAQPLQSKCVQTGQVKLRIQSKCVEAGQEKPSAFKANALEQAK
jgi:hypothetical protein